MTLVFRYLRDLMSAITTSWNRFWFSPIDPATLGLLLAAVYALASLAQVVVGRLIDRMPLKRLYLAIMVAQVPLFGPLLSGGRNEGLFAVNFRLTGQTGAPTLTVNPLSAVAPGFLRKLFGTGGDRPTGSLQGNGDKSRENANN